MKAISKEDKSVAVRTIVSKFDNELAFFIGRDKHTWIAKVIGYQDEMLLLENKKGEIILESIDDIKSVSPFRPNKKRKEVLGNREEVS
jgi:hypothetical protein